MVVVGETVLVVEEVDVEVGGSVLVVVVEVAVGRVEVVPTCSADVQLARRIATRTAGIHRFMVPQRVERPLGSSEPSMVQRSEDVGAGAHCLEDVRNRHPPEADCAPRATRKPRIANANAVAFRGFAPRK